MFPLILVIVGIAMILPACLHKTSSYAIKYSPEEILYLAMMFIGAALVIIGITLAGKAWIG